MAPKKLAVTSKALQALLTRIGSASSGTKSTLLARFQRDVQQPGFFNRQHGRAPNEGVQSEKLRIVSIDMGIKNLAFCDAEISRASLDKQDFSAHMHVLRWKKLDLMGSAAPKSSPSSTEDDGVEDAADEEGDPFSPSALSKTAHRLIVDEILSANPDLILIERQRWRSGGGSAVQQWTVRVNTLEAMLWAILETVKQGSGLPLPPNENRRPEVRKHGYSVHAVDPKRVGQYWLSQHARALHERNADAAALDDARDPEDINSPPEPPNPPKNPSRSKAEKSAKIALLRAWLSSSPRSTAPSTSPSMPVIAFTIAPAAEATLRALLPKPNTKPKTKTKVKTSAPRRNKAETDGEEELADDIPVKDLKKLDDVADCFLQAAAWVAWEGGRGVLLGCSGVEGEEKEKEKGKGEGGVVDEERVVRMLERCGQM